MGKYQKNIEAARRITVMQYLETYHPGELVRKTDREYCTRTHDSLIITPANGFFHWFSRHVGGNNAIDYLTKVEGMDFVSAVRLLNEMAPVTVSFQPAKAAPVKPHEPRPFTLPTPDRNAEDPECDTVEIYEAPIDAMSGATIRQYKHDRPWRSVHYLALGGLNHQPIDYFLAHHPAVKTAVLCFDRDEPGRNFAGTVAKKLTEKNLVVVDMPPAVGKDYNEYLVAAKKLISMER